eukprot:5143782-Amphidinium_carterae.1
MSLSCEEKAKEAGGRLHRFAEVVRLNLLPDRRLRAMRHAKLTRHQTPKQTKLNGVSNTTQ